MLDLDGFKIYDDRLGHTVGDDILRSFAASLGAGLRKSDLAFRYGGDEFAVVLPATDADRARRLINRLRRSWAEARAGEYTILDCPLSFCAGLAQCPGNAETADSLVFLADTALLHSKRLGGRASVTVSELEALSRDAPAAATPDQVYALAAAVDAKDAYTYGHSKRVAHIAEAIGRAIDLPPAGLSDLRAAALLHDIGKIGVPDSILTKRGALAESEKSVVRKHSAQGAKIVGYVKELGDLVPSMLHHHEWYDGSGYPAGLRGGEIPLGARIISVADAYDTMTTKRLYRKAMSTEEAMQELRRCADTQFDPDLVDSFCLALANGEVQEFQQPEPGLVEETH